jgi:hypothetical protein
VTAVGAALFAVGYRLMPEESEPFCDIVADYRDLIHEVYFAWPGFASGRTPLPTTARQRVMAELRRIRDNGVRLNLLLNASCYGVEAVSRSFSDRVVALTRELAESLGVDAITTMSPLVAGAIKASFPRIDIRASVNMRLGTVRAMEYVAHLYDSYYVQRELNRDAVRLGELKEWAAARSKGLHILANSGCLCYCSFQTFHDNVVSHEAEIAAAGDALQVGTLCRHFYGSAEHKVGFLQSSWIRPEDISRHHALFGTRYKLATRAHDNPRLVLDAYCRGRHHGNLLDLMEPGFSPEFRPFIIDNRKFPADWCDTTLACGQRCGECSYCAGVLDRVLVNLEDPAGFRRLAAERLGSALAMQPAGPKISGCG